MQKLQELRGRRDTIAASARQLHADHKDKSWDQAAGEKYDQLISEINDLDTAIAREQKFLDSLAEEKIDDQLAEAKAKRVRAGGSSLFAKWIKGGDKAMSAQDWADIRATMSTTTPAEGGYSVPTDVYGAVLDVLKAYGGVREVATVIQTEAGNPINFPTSDGTSETGELIGENTTATGADTSFGVVTLSTYKFSSKIVAVPFELLQDSAVDMEAFIAKRLGERLGRTLNSYFTTGTGSSQPNGVVTASSVGKTGTTGQTASVIYDDLVDLEHSINRAYRSSPGFGFMMADSSLKVVRKIKDSNGRPIFVPGYEQGNPGGAPDRLLNRPITINDDVAAMAANAKSILMGDFRKYVIRRVMDLTLFRMTDSAFTLNGQVGFVAFQRIGGNLIDAGGAVKYYANSAT